MANEFGPFDTFWIDQDDTSWGLRDGQDGIELYAKPQNGIWDFVVDIPIENLEEMGFYLDINK